MDGSEHAAPACPDAVAARATAALARFPPAAGLELGEIPEPGLINRTWSVGVPPRFVLQLVNPVIPAPADERLDLVTRHLALHGLPTPRLVRDRFGRAATPDPEGGRWRLLTFVPGTTWHRLPHPRHACAAGALVGRFHAALQDLAGQLEPLRLQVHETPRHMRRLEETLSSCADHRLAAGIRRTGEGILDCWRRYGAAVGGLTLPERPAHGDLKVSNVRFDPDGEKAVCLVDFDTLGRLPLDAEIGDALRSWCNPLGEDAGSARVDVELFAATVEGYLRAATFVTVTEREALVPGLWRIATELAARFCVDAHEERYFGWDPRVSPSRGDHNLLRARCQLELALDVERRRGELQAIVTRVG
jgi:Ser/Thr protein kinase RdoA (MazF antagonist)